MDINDVLALAKAGYTRDEISKIALAVPAQTPATVPQQTPVTVPQQTPVTVPAQTPVTVPAQTPVTVPQQTPVTTPADAILKELGLIKDTMQANALFGAQMPKPESTEDILASIINPPEIKK